MSIRPTRQQWSECVDAINALPHPPEFLTRYPGADRHAEDYKLWCRMYAREGSTAWRQCQTPSWALTWPTHAGPPSIVFGPRPTPWRLARRSGVCTCGPTPPDPDAVTAQLHGPGPPPVRWGPVHLVKHWWWWRHARATRIRRGDLRILAAALPEQPALRADLPIRVVDLACDYPDLIHAATSGDLWARRLRRRRRVRISTTPPPLHPAVRWLLWTRHPRGDLTWAPRPPAPPAAIPPPRLPGPAGYSYHYHGSWLLRGGTGPMPPGYHPLPPGLATPRNRAPR